MKGKKKRLSLQKKRVKKFKELTGRKRLSSEIKNLLNIFTPSQVVKGLSDSNKKTWGKRIASYKKLGGEINNISHTLLAFMTPKNVYKVLSQKQVREERERERSFPSMPKEEIPTPSTDRGIPTLGKCDYDHLPSNIKNLSHRSGDWLYECSAWNLREIDFDVVATDLGSYGSYANDYNNIEIARMFIRARGLPIKVVKIDLMHAKLEWE